jgi:hypothetical protein
MADPRNFLGGGGSIATPPPNRPTQVFQSPSGLLDFLGTKTIGHNPDLLAQVLTPTLNLMPFYLAGQEIKRQQFSTLTPALFNRIDFIVPPGRAWIPLFQGITQICTGVGEQVRVRTGLFDSNGFVLQTCQAVPSTATQASNSQGCSSTDWWINPVVIPPGFGFGVVHEFMPINPCTNAPQSHVLSYIELIV